MSLPYIAYLVPWPIASSLPRGDLVGVDDPAGAILLIMEL